MTLYLAIVQQIVIYKLQYNVYSSVALICRAQPFWNYSIVFRVFVRAFVAVSAYLFIFEEKKQYAINIRNASAHYTKHTPISEANVFRCIKYFQIRIATTKFSIVFRFSLRYNGRAQAHTAMLLRFLSLKIREKELKTYTIYIRKQSKAKQKKYTLSHTPRERHTRIHSGREREK